MDFAFSKTAPQDCPCQENCPQGCPCANYECQQTTTSSLTTTSAPGSSVLILNTYLSDNVPVITDANGRFDTDLAFELDANLTVYGSCSLTFKNEFYIFGGGENYHQDQEWTEDMSRQILKVDGCGLRKIGSLPFEHNRGGCAAVGDDKIYLCFGDWESESCRYASHPTGSFNDVRTGFFEHGSIRIAASKGNIYRT